MKYIVSWSIEVEAETPRAAAIAAWNQFREPTDPPMLGVREPLLPAQETERALEEDLFDVGSDLNSEEE